jgi:hypothetical protein
MPVPLREVVSYALQLLQEGVEDDRYPLVPVVGLDAEVAPHDARDLTAVE